jgi:DNA-directed RNA polymerase subunit RPC12/RpoP
MARGTNLCGSAIPDYKSYLLLQMAPSHTFDVFIYGSTLLGVFGFLWIYYDRRDRSLYELQRRRITFHCIRCDHLYTGVGSAETVPCPKCGHQNVRLKF